jgi:hypothetical protein
MSTPTCRCQENPDCWKANEDWGEEDLEEQDLEEQDLEEQDWEEQDWEEGFRKAL